MSHLLNISLVAILSLLWMQQLVGQPYTHTIRTFGLKDGLMHRKVNCLYEDSQGFIWTGHQKGIQRFDGYNFKTWRRTLDHPDLENITTIVEDDEGWLWLFNATLKKFVFFNPNTEIFLGQKERFGREFPIVINSSFLSGWTPPIRNIPQTVDGTLVFLSSEPSEIITYSHGEFTRTPFPALTANFLELYLLDSRGQLWVTDHHTRSNLYKIDLKGNILQTWQFPNNYDICNFYEKQDTVFFRVLYNNTKQNKLDHTMHYIVDDESHQIIGDGEEYEGWIIGRWNWQYNDNKLVLSQGDINAANCSLPVTEYLQELLSSAQHTLEDKSGKLWIASELGLGVISVETEKFQRYFSFSNTKEKPIHNAARGIATQGGKLYANFEYGGLVEFDLQNPNNYRILIQDHQYEGRPLLLNGNTLTIGYLDELIEVSTIAPQPIESKLLSGQNLIWSLWQDEQEGVWVGSRSSLAYAAKGQLKASAIAAADSLPLNDIFHITPDADGKRWLAAQSGLYHFDPQEKQFLARFGNQAGAHFLPSGTFYFTHIDSEGIFWLGSDDGLIRWDKDSGQYRLFTTEDGLSNDVIYAVLADDHGRLWLTSDYGLMHFDKTTHKVRSYLPKDGIAHEEFNKTSFHQAADGTMYFGGLNGITAFHPNDFLQDEEQISPQLVLTGFDIYDGDASALKSKVVEARRTGQIRMYPSDRYLRLSFALLTMANTDRNIYGWKIEGVDEGWNYQKENTIQIGKLPFGEQTLRIKGQAADGQWSSEELAFTIQVVPPIYLRTWFLILSFLLVLGGTFAFFNNRTRRFKRRQEILQKEVTKATRQIQHDKEVIEHQAAELKALDQLKSRFFANVSHELRTPLSLMLGPIRRLNRKGQQHNKENRMLLGFLERNTIHLQNLVNEILDLSKLENNKMELEEVATPLHLFLTQHLHQYYSIGNSERTAVEGQLLIAEDLVVDLDQNKFKKVLNNFLSNAIKFSPALSTIEVYGKTVDQHILVSVTDQGRGIHSDDLPHIFDRFYQAKKGVAVAEGGTGIGLSMCRELAQMMGGEVWAESTLGQGSTFYFKLPLKVASGGVANELKQADTPTPSAEGSLVKTSLTPVSETTTILIAEDNQDLRDYYKIILSDYQVKTFANGKEALEYLQAANAPDLIISDLMMPVMDGMEFISQLKDSTEWAHIPVIMLTAKMNQEVKIKALRYGIDDYLNKPFDEEELSIRIQNLIQHRKNRMEADKGISNTSDSRVLFSKSELRWLEEVENYVVQNISSDLLSAANLCHTFAMSESTLLRQLKRLTGLTPLKYIQEIKLHHAKHLLQTRAFKTVSEVAYHVGYKSAKTFSRNFKGRFGKAPAEMY